MNEFKHTPAPWTVELGIRSAAIVDDRKNEIAIVEIGIYDVETEAELEANATLMAESPNLLKCLIDMVEVNDEPCRFDHKGFCQAHYLDHESEGCRVANAKAAIAKVRGE